MLYEVVVNALESDITLPTGIAPCVTFLRSRFIGVPQVGLGTGTSA